MKGRIIHLLFLAYLTVDLANPLMPGAFQFVGATLGVVEAVSARADLLSAPVLPPAGAPAIEIRLEPEPPVRHARAYDLALRLPPARRALARPTAPAPSTEDH